MYQGQYLNINNFSGGYCGGLSPIQLKSNQAADLDNIVIFPNGAGFRSRYGNDAVGGFSSAVHGIGFLNQTDGDRFMGIVTAAQFHTTTYDGTPPFSFSNSTGTATITNDVAAVYTFVTFNDAMIGFGGLRTAPTAPFRWPGTGTAAALGGSAPAAWGGFTANNRVFAYRTAANPSTVYWSVLGDAEDWTSTGAGSAVIGTLNDGEAITAAAVIGTNTAIIFKETRCYQMSLTSAPFPNFTLFNAGCIGKQSLCVVDDKVYFIDQSYRLRATNGETIEDFPNVADDLFSSITPEFKDQLVVFRQKGTDYDWVVISGVTQPANIPTRAVAWDLVNKCWIKLSTGYVGTICASTDFLGVVLTGNYDNGLYRIGVPGTFTDTYSSVATAITSFWQSGWMNSASLDQIVRVDKLNVQLKTQASGSVTASYGFDFLPNTSSFTISQVATGAESYTTRGGRVTGRGNVFEFKISLASSAVGMQISGIEIGGKISGQKVISAD